MVGRILFACLSFKLSAGALLAVVCVYLYQEPITRSTQMRLVYIAPSTVVEKVIFTTALEQIEAFPTLIGD